MSSEPRWIRVTRCNNIPLREGRAVDVAGKEVAIFNLGDRFLAIENRCPHRGGPLADGIVSGNQVVCPLHAWKVCLDDGAVAKPAGAQTCVSSYETRVEDGVVCIQLPAKPRAVTEQEIPTLFPSGDLGEAAGVPDLDLGSVAG